MEGRGEMEGTGISMSGNGMVRREKKEKGKGNK